jgi:phosphate transport system permease protein
MDSSFMQLGILLSVLAVTFYGVFVLYKVTPNFQTINLRERAIKVLLICGTIISIYITLAIVLSVIYESYLFFQHVGIFEFIFGTHWSPQSGSFGAIPLFVGTFLITFIAMAVAGPLGLYSAIYISEYASRGARSYIKPVLEILAGIPTVVYGYFAALTIAPMIRDFGEMLDFAVATESALAAGAVMGIMIIPYVLSLSDDVINSVPQSLRDASYALGATKSETIKKVVLPAALPGIMGAMLLGVSRAVGETMIVVMAAGMAANLTINPLESVTTVTVQIVAMLTGDQEFSSPKTLSAFALGLALFLVTLALNIYALRIVKKYREIYD